MTKLVLLHKTNSIYDDEPAVRYDFPRSYLKAVREAVGDWVVYYEPVKAGQRSYFAAARISDVIENPAAPGRYIAVIAPNSYVEFVSPVPRTVDGSPLESALRDADGRPKKGGAVQLAVRRLTEPEFETIVDLGLPQDLERMEAERYNPAPFEMHDQQIQFRRPVLERLTRRPYRDVAFRRNVREAYGYRCAMSGLRLRNGGGRPEVQAAHIRPVDAQGSDSVLNGLALSGTLHWMFDRGLISVADDDRTILVSRNKVPDDVIVRLIRPERTLLPPIDPRDAPHPANLRWHRENVFGQAEMNEATPWD